MKYKPFKEKQIAKIKYITSWEGVKWEIEKISLKISQRAGEEINTNQEKHMLSRKA